MNTSVEQPVDREPSGSRASNRKHVRLLLIVAIPVAITLVIVFPPSKYPMYLPCPMYFWSGYHCAGCGSTRAVASLIVGDVRQALAYNFVFVILLPVLLLYGALRSVAKYRGDQRPFVTLPRWLVWPVTVLVIVYTILRNIPHPMFTWLAPHSLS